MVNTFTTLFLEQTYIRLYEQQYITAGTSHQLNSRYRLSDQILFAARHQLSNHADTRLIDRPSVETYADNQPDNLELSSTAFPDHHTLLAEAKLSARPWQTFRRYNGNLVPLEGSSPTLSIGYRKGIPDLFSSAVNFDYLQIGVQHTFNMHLGR